MYSLEQAKLRIVGVLVAFDRDRNPLSAVDTALVSIDHVVVVDNSPSGHPALTAMEGKSRLTVIKNHNIGGLAGAYNAAISRINHDHPDATHVLFLDDDTDTCDLSAFLASDVTLEAASKGEIAAVAPAYVDRETGLRGAHIRLNAFSYKILPRDTNKPTKVSFLINSMSLWRLSAIRRIGSYSTRLGVDHVDTDYCLRAALIGYELVLNPNVTFIHSIGKRQKYRILGKTLQSGGHSPERRELIARNTIILGRHYFFRFPSFAILCTTRIFYEMLGIMMVESNRLKKLFAIIKGVVFGIVTRYA